MVGDSFWTNVKRLLHFDGVNNGVRIYDECGGAVTLTGTPTLRTAQSKFGGASLYLNGLGSKIGFDFEQFTSQSVWTLEGFVFPLIQTNATPAVFAFLNNYTNSLSFGLYVDHTAAPDKFSFWYGAHSTSVPLLVSTSSVAYDAWSHVAITRNVNTFTLWVNGVAESVGVISSALNISGSLFIGSASNASGNTAYDFIGYVDEFRYTLHHLRYVTSPAAVPTTPFLNYGSTGLPIDPHYGDVVLHSHFDGEPGASNFVDRKGHTLSLLGSPQFSASYSSFGGSSVVMAPSVSGVYVSSPDIILGSNDFTIEAFAATSLGYNDAIPLVSFINAGGTGVSLLVTVSSGSSNTAIHLNGTQVTSPSIGGIGAGAPRHVAICREGSTLSLYIAGSRVSQAQIGTGEISCNGTFYIGKSPYWGPTDTSMLYVDEFRFTNGVARFSSAATSIPVPTEPFPDFGPGRFSGFVIDVEGGPLARPVKLFHRETCTLVDTTLSDPVTGEFSLKAMDLEPYFIVVLDEGAKPAKIFDHMIPTLEG